MPIRVLVGRSGAGKTAEIINITSGLRSRSERVFLLASLDGGVVRAAMRDHSVIGDRSGRSIKVDFKGGVVACRSFLAENSSGRSTFLFDEAHRFGADFVTDWISLSEAGHEVVVSTPGEKQLEALRAAGAYIDQLRKSCDLLADGEASITFVLPGCEGTISVCQSCAGILRKAAREKLYERLIATAPYPGEKRVYQPIDVDFPEYGELVPVRTDSFERSQIMAEFVARHVGKFEFQTRTYIDVGCNTGFFCKKMAELGFQSTGIDIAPNDIEMGKVADTYFYRRYLNLICENALTYVPNTMEVHDVSSTFSVYQWMFDQEKTTEAVFRSLHSLMDKTRKLFFFEMGYTKEEHYKDRLSVTIDRDWCLMQLKEYGRFDEIVTFEEGDRGLKRDFFVGIRA